MRLGKRTFVNGGVVAEIRFDDIALLVDAELRCAIGDDSADQEWRGRAALPYVRGKLHLLMCATREIARDHWDYHSCLIPHVGDRRRSNVLTHRHYPRNRERAHPDRCHACDCMGECISAATNYVGRKWNCCLAVAAATSAFTQGSITVKPARRLRRTGYSIGWRNFNRAS
jgi:hypothetical protein